MPSPDDASPAPPNPLPPGSDPLPDLLAECIEAVDRHGPAAVEAILAKVPQHAASLRRALGQLDLVGLLPDHANERGVQQAEEAMPERLGEFRLRARLGGGGMGVVYLAEQTSLGRLVAIKLVRPDQLYFGGARARFRREVEIVARLQDPGIVPIHTVGNEGGIPFFAMEYVAGGSLADVLLALAPRRHERLTGRDLAAVVAARAGVAVPEPLPALFVGTWVQCCCRIVAAMAQALQHAHERGVVHRDLKPSNALLTPGGRVMLCDFGLATDGTSPLTQAGQQVGTVAYMAPEQMRGEAADVRTDVYGLGVTLFELLQGSPAFAAENGEELRQRILAGRPAQHDPGRDVPRDAWTVCAKAMAVEPDRRYTSARAVADDLANFLAARPVTARPAGPLVRLSRWRRRHPAAAVALGLGLLAAGIGIAAWSSLRGLSATARRNLEQALAVLKGQIERSHSDELGAIPGLDELRVRELEGALATLQRLRAENAGDPDVRVLFVEGMLMACDVQLETNQPEKVDAMLSIATRELDELATMVDHRTITMLQGRVLVHRGELARWRGDLEATERAMDAAVPLLEPLLAAGEPVTGATRELARSQLANVLANRGSCRVLRGDLDGGDADLERSLQLDAQGDGGRTSRRPHALTVRQTRGILQLRRGRVDEAKETFAGVVAELERRLTAAKHSPELARELARARRGLGIVHGTRRDWPAAIAATAAAVTAMDPLVQQFPARHVYAWERNLYAYELSRLHLVQRDLPAGITVLRRAVADQERLVAANADRFDFRHDLARMKGSLGAMLGQTEDEADVGTLLAAAVALDEQVATARPEDAAVAAQLANLRSNLALHLLHSDDVDGAARTITAAVDAFERLLARGAVLPVLENQFPFTMQLAAQICVVQGDAATAVQHLARLQAVAPIPRASLEAFGKQLSLTEREDFRAMTTAAK